MAIRIDAETDGYSAVTVADNTFTLMCWCYLSVDRNAYSTIFDMATSTSSYMQVSTDGTGTQLGIYTNAGATFGTNMVVGNWYRLGVTCDGTTLRIYSAGVSGALATTSIPMPAGFNPTTLRIGKSVWANEFFNGRIANFKMWDAVLTQDQLDAEFAQYQPQLTTALIRLYPFLVPETVDYSGQANTLTAGSTVPGIEDGPPIRWGRARGSRVKVDIPPGIIHDIGPGETQNHFEAQLARAGDPAVFEKSQAEIAAGFSERPIFYTVSDRVHFEARLDAPTTAGSSFSRAEMRETNADGSNATWNPQLGEHIFDGSFIVTELPPVKPDAVFWQIFGETATSDVVSLRTQLVSGTIRMRLRVNGVSITSPQIAAPYVIGTRINFRAHMINGTLNFYFSTGADPLPGTPQIVNSDVTETAAYFKYGLYNQSNVAAGDAGTAIGSAEHYKPAVTHLAPTLLAPVVDAGADATITNRQPFSRTAGETGGPPDTREWKIQSGPDDVGAILDTDAVLIWTPTVPGVYVLRYTASNTTGSDFDDVTVTVNAVVVALAGLATAQGSVLGAAAVVRVPRLEGTGAADTSSTGLVRRIVRASAAAAASANADGAVARTVKIFADAVAATSASADAIAVRRSEATAIVDTSAVGTLRRARLLEALAVAVATASAGAITRLRLLEGTATARAYVVRAELKPTVAGYARTVTTAIGGLLRVRAMSGETTAQGSAELNGFRVIMQSGLLEATTSAQGDQRIVTTASEIIRVDTDATGSQLPIVSMRADEAIISATIEPTTLHALSRLSKTITAVASAIGVQLPVRRMEKTLQVESDASATVQRTTLGSGEATARVSVPEAVLLAIRVNLTEIAAQARASASGLLTRTIEMFSVAQAHGVIPPTHMRRSAKFLNALAEAAATAGERPGRVVETTAQAFGYAHAFTQRSVNNVRGYITALSNATGELTLGPVLHAARAIATARGSLRPVRRIAEIVTAEATADDVRLRAVYEMTSVVREVPIGEHETLNAYAYGTRDDAEVPFADEDEIPEFERIFLGFRS